MERSGSSMVVVTDAVLEIVDGVPGAVTVTLTLPSPPVAIVPSAHVSVIPSQLHPGADTKVSSGGSVSVMVTFSASLGPALLTCRA